MEQVVMPVFFLFELGVRTLIVTNAAGGVNRAYQSGDLVLIRDHINLMGANPLRGPNPEDLGPRFPDMSKAYDQSLRSLAQRVSKDKLEEGVYAAFAGPTYETPAEVRMAEILGADLVGMSTVPEVIAANYLGMRVLGISCVTNMAAGILDKPFGGRRGWTFVDCGQRYPESNFPGPKFSIGWMRAHVASLFSFLDNVSKGYAGEPGFDQGIYIQHVIERVRESARLSEWVRL